MTLSPLLSQLGWLRLNDVRAYLSHELNGTVTYAEVLKLGLDKRLPLSLYLPPETDAEEFEIAPDGSQKRLGHTRIGELWNLWIDDPATRLQLTHEYEYAASQTLIPLGQIGGACVLWGARRFRLKPDLGHSGGFSPRARSAFPVGSALGVQRLALERFIGAQRALVPASATKSHEAATPERELSWSERSGLLVVIAALAKHCNIDINRPSKAASIISGLTNELNARVAPSTIEGYLKSVEEAIDRRSK